MFLTLLEIVTVNKEPLSFLIYLPCKVIVLTYLSEDGLRTGQNMQHTCQGDNMN